MQASGERGCGLPGCGMQILADSEPRMVPVVDPGAAGGHGVANPRAGADKGRTGGGGCGAAEGPVEEVTQPGASGRATVDLAVGLDKDAVHAGAAGLVPEGRCALQEIEAEGAFLVAVENAGIGGGELAGIPADLFALGTGVGGGVAASIPDAAEEDGPDGESIGFEFTGQGLEAGEGGRGDDFGDAGVEAACLEVEDLFAEIRHEVEAFAFGQMQGTTDASGARGRKGIGKVLDGRGGEVGDEAQSVAAGKAMAKSGEVGMQERLATGDEEEGVGGERIEGGG